MIFRQYYFKWPADHSTSPRSPTSTSRSTWNYWVYPLFIPLPSHVLEIRTIWPNPLVEPVFTLKQRQKNGLKHTSASVSWRKHVNFRVGVLEVKVNACQGRQFYKVIFSRFPVVYPCATTNSISSFLLIPAQRFFSDLLDWLTNRPYDNTITNPGQSSVVDTI
jgi:hypothetical protein